MLGSWGSRGIQGRPAGISPSMESFDDAKTVFDDDLFLVFADPDHSTNESRFIIMGQSKKGRLLVVAYTEEIGCDSHHKCAGRDPPRAKNLCGRNLVEESMTNCGRNTISAHCALWPVDRREEVPMKQPFAWRPMSRKRFLIPNLSMRPCGF